MLQKLLRETRKSEAHRLTIAAIAAFTLMMIAFVVYLVATGAGAVLVSTVLLLAGTTITGVIMERRDADSYRRESPSRARRDEAPVGALSTGD